MILDVSLAGLAVALVVVSGVFWFVERRWPALPPRPRPQGSLRTDLIYWFVTPIASRLAAIVAALVAAVLVAAFFGAPSGEGLQRFFERETMVNRQPLWLQTLELLLLLDLTSYWGHRWFHTDSFLWRFHAVHHSSRWVDWLSSVRVHPLNDLGMKLLQTVPMLVLGFDFSAVAIAVPVLTAYAILLHANVPWGLGPLRYVFVTPVFHRWHHTSQEEGLNKNFSGLFVWPDLVFGTFYLPKGRQPERFGLAGEAMPESFIGQTLWAFRRKRAQP
jgi:sterol desaturase/sphingolipid hydroxylase (fatty acid hydroxylase superfamily)